MFNGSFFKRFNLKDIWLRFVVPVYMGTVTITGGHGRWAARSRDTLPAQKGKLRANQRVHHISFFESCKPRLLFSLACSVGRFPSCLFQWSFGTHNRQTVYDLWPSTGYCYRGRAVRRWFAPDNPGDQYYLDVSNLWRPLRPWIKLYLYRDLRRGSQAFYQETIFGHSLDCNGSRRRFVHHEPSRTGLAQCPPLEARSHDISWYGDAMRYTWVYIQQTSLR